MNRERYSAEMLRAFAQMDRIAMFTVCRNHKDCARRVLRYEDGGSEIMTRYAAHMTDRWFRRLAAIHPMGKFIHGSTYEEPKRKGPITRTIPIRRG